MARPAKGARAKRLAKAKEAKAKREAAKASKGQGGDKALSKEEQALNGYRFCTGNLDSRPLSKDVKIGGFSLTSYGRELVKDTEIELTIGRRYGLLGANGCGKSEFLKCLANREVPIPEHIDIYFLDEEAEPSDRTAVEAVIDVVRQQVKDLEAESERVITDPELGPDSARAMDIMERLDDLDPATFEVRACKLLHGLGFDQEMMAKATKDMSGGWRMRVALARALFVKPTLLLLDEPTNHLDLEACVWLEEYLSTYDRCLMVISHSQDFMNGVCTNIIHITPTQKLVNYTGNYDTFVKTKSENEVNQMKRYNKEQEDISHIKQFISSCGTYSNLVKQAKSKQKILDKMYAAGLTPKVVEDPAFNFRFNDCDRLPPPLIAFRDVSFSYSGEVKDELYRKVSVGVDMDSRVAIVGPNGAGKSTLLKLMTGDLTPNEGEVKKHAHLQYGKYSQHSNDQLDVTKTPLEFIVQQFPDHKKEEPAWRAHLGRFGITGQKQKQLIGTMSDGLKSRLVFALMSVKTPGLLLLDEPTNHLDMTGIDALADAINHFNGGMVLVSHDFRLISQVTKEIWVVDHKKISRWHGSIRDYKKSLVDKMEL